MDTALQNDPEYRSDLDAVAKDIGERLGKECRYYPEHRAVAADGSLIEKGSFISHAWFAVAPLGEGAVLSIGRMDIRGYSSGRVSPEARKLIDAYVATLQ